MSNREVMQQALQALEDLGMKHYESTGEVLHRDVYEALRAALAEPQETKEKGACASYAQTPSRQGSPQGEHRERAHQAPDLSSIVPAPQRQPLTEEEISNRLWESEWPVLARAIKRAHGIGGQDE